MKKLSIIIFLAIAGNTSAQVIWYQNFKAAQAVAMQKDQLILMDFWATWCGPCKTMDKELWSQAEVAEFSKNFVPFKVDVDYNRELAMKYNATSIPKVILVTVTGEVVWEQTGFSMARAYKEVLSKVPNSLNGLNKVLHNLMQEESIDNYFKAGKAAQNIGVSLTGEIGEGLFDISDDYFKHVEKKSDEEQLVALAELNQLLNDAYRGKYKKAIRKLDKVEVTQNQKIDDLKNFIKAFCYKCNGDDEKYLESKKQITDSNLVSDLEQN